MSQLTRVAAAVLAFKPTNLCKHTVEAIDADAGDALGSLSVGGVVVKQSGCFLAVGASVEKLDAAAVKLAWVTAEVLRIKA